MRSKGANDRGNDAGGGVGVTGVGRRNHDGLASNGRHVQFADQADLSSAADFPSARHRLLRMAMEDEGRRQLGGGYEDDDDDWRSSSQSSVSSFHSREASQLSQHSTIV